MNWIRSPAWDGFWILSAPALGLLLVLCPWLISAWLVINFAHAVSPILLAWTHEGYRPIMLAKPQKFILVPTALMATAVAIACATTMFFPTFVPQHVTLENISFSNLGVPIVIWLNLYAAWNLYHGGAQNFGIWCLYRGKGYAPGWGKLAVLGGFVVFVVMVSHFLPRVFSIEALALFVLGMISFNHSLAAIGLCAHVHGRHHHISPLYFVGCVLFVGAFSATLFMTGYRHSLFLAVLVMSLRGALGIWHFLQDRWIWRLSDPQVRATIGYDLFGPPKLAQKAAA